MKSVPIGKVAKFVNGRAFKPSEWETEGLPIIRIQNLTGSSQVVNYFSGEYDQKHLIKRGDILISWSASLGVYRWEGKDSLLNQHIFKVVTKDHLVDKDYFYFSASSVIDDMLSQVHGTTMRHITKEPFESTEIPLPPLDAQKRIAAILSKADRLRRLRRYARELSDGYLGSVFLEMFGDPVANPMRWDIVKSASQIEHIDSGWSPICDDEPRTNSKQWAVLRLSAVTTGTYLPNENKLLPQDLEPRPELEVKYGDVLITRKNTVDLVAACTFVHETPPRLMLPDTIFRFSIKKGCNLKAEYLWGLFSEKTFRKKVQSLASGTAGSMPNISKEKFLNINLPLPPLPLQQKFARIVQKYDRLRAQQREAERQAEHLFQSLLHRAFRGEL